MIRICVLILGTITSFAAASHHSRGHFDDDVNGTPQSEDAVIVERFTLSEDDTRLEWEGTITDPANFVGPAVLRMAWQWIPGEEIKPYQCALPETEPA